jgi:stage IV sporulation protein FB
MRPSGAIVEGSTRGGDLLPAAPRTTSTAGPSRFRWSARLGAIAGIEVRVHATMLLLVWLVALGSDAYMDAVSTIGWFVLVFACVLAHELAHSLVARRVGVEVREIELLPIGGVSKMDRIPDEPNDELAISLAGPLMSATIGVTALALAAAAGADVWPPAIYSGSLLAGVGWFNLLVAGFNLLPALPLDGGRAFRALLERHVGPEEATHRAAHLARILAIVMIAVGVLVNLFLMLIGWFVYLTSRAEEAVVTLHERLDGATVGDVMVRQPVVLHEAQRVSDLVSVLTETTQRQFPVVAGDGSYRGIVDSRTASTLDPAIVLARVAVPEPPVAPSQSVEELDELWSSRRGAVAVVEAGAVVGLLRAEDVQLLAERVTAAATRAKAG